MQTAKQIRPVRAAKANKSFGLSEAMSEVFLLLLVLAFFFAPLSDVAFDKNFPSSEIKLEKEAVNSSRPKQIPILRSRKQSNGAATIEYAVLFLSVIAKAAAIKIAQADAVISCWLDL